MTKKVCVYSCITGDYDNLHDILYPEKTIDYYCFTNNKNLKSNTWKIIYIENNGLDNVRLARKIKILGHPIINQYETVVWTDADVIWQQPISKFIKSCLKTSSLAIFKHHVRNNIRDEAIACLRLRKDDKATILKTLHHYESVGYPDNNGLCESTVFIKKPNDPKVVETMQIWFDIVKDFSRRDQLSFNYAVWKTKLKVNYINLNVWDNSWFFTAKHTPNKIIDECHVYYGNPDLNFDFNKYQTYKYQQKNNTYFIRVTVPNNTSEIEFNPSDITGLNYCNIIIKPNPKRIAIFGASHYSHNSAFCNSHGIIRIYGHFQKKQIISFSIEMSNMSRGEIDALIEHQYNKNDQLIKDNESLRSEIKNLQSTNRQLKTELQVITNSKGWQILEKIRKIKTLHK